MMINVGEMPVAEFKKLLEREIKGDIDLLIPMLDSFFTMWSNTLQFSGAVFEHGLQHHPDFMQLVVKHLPICNILSDPTRKQLIDLLLQLKETKH